MSETSNTKTPFLALADYEKRSLVHAVGLPEQIQAQGAWSGIGFRLGELYLLVGLKEVAEILHLPPMTNVPGSKAWLMGIANVRGNLVAVVDLRGFLIGQRTKLSDSSRVLVIRQEGGNVGLLIDEVLGQRHLFDDDNSDQGGFEETIVAPFVHRGYRKDDIEWGVFDSIQLTQTTEFLQAAAA